MSSIKLPIVPVSFKTGQAAELASRHRVGAFLVQAGAGLSLINVEHLPATPGGKVSDITGLGRPVRVLGGISTEDFASIELGDAEHAAINEPIGFMRCSLNKAHTYPPSVQGNCPKGDGGHLDLVFF